MKEGERDRGSEGGQSFPQGMLGQFGHIVDPQLAHDLHLRGLNGLGADIEGVGDFFGAIPLGNLLQHLSLLRGRAGKDRIVRRERLLLEILQYRAGKPATASLV